MTALPCPQCGHLVNIPAIDLDAPTSSNPFVPPIELPAPIAVNRLPSAESGKPMFALTLIAPYAVLMTVVAATFAYKFYTAQFEHPLAVIPDLIGEYRNASQRKGGAHSVPLPKPDQPLPAHLTTSINVPTQVGQVEVTPLKIEFRPWTAHSKNRRKDEPDVVPIKETLVLTLRIRNTSTDQIIFPMDPYFDRRPKDDDRTMPFSLIEAGGKKHYGGVIAFETDRGDIEREWIEGRESDNRPLMPGESREVVLVARPSAAREVADALQKAGSKATWRVHLRRGLYEFQGREYSVAAVIGVRFAVGDLQTA